MHEFHIAETVTVREDDQAVMIDDWSLPFHTTVDGFRTEVDSEGFEVVRVGIVLKPEWW